MPWQPITPAMCRYGSGWLAGNYKDIAEFVESISVYPDDESSSGNSAEP